MIFIRSDVAGVACLTDYPEVVMYDSMEQAARVLEFVSASSVTEAMNGIDDKH